MFFPRFQEASTNQSVEVGRAPDAGDQPDDLIRHLDICALCQRALETLAGDPAARKSCPLIESQIRTRVERSPGGLSSIMSPWRGGFRAGDAPLPASGRADCPARILTASVSICCRRRNILFSATAPVPVPAYARCFRFRCFARAVKRGCSPAIFPSLPGARASREFRSYGDAATGLL